MIWVRSPNSATRMSMKPAPDTFQKDWSSGLRISSSPSSFLNSSTAAPPRKSAPVIALTSCCGSRVSTLPAATASATCTAKAAATPAKT
ncbi:hypothetical protein SHIRM173S_11018 [Streptomyces hirsutus]